MKMKNRSFVAKVENVYPIYLHAKQGKDHAEKAVMAKDLDKVMIYGKSYVVAKGSVKAGDDVVVIPAGSTVDREFGHDWFKFLNGRVKLARKCGIVSHGVVIPNVEVRQIILDVRQRCEPSIILTLENVNLRDYSNVMDLDDILKVDKYLSKDEEAIVRYRYECIRQHEKEIQRIYQS